MRADALELGERGLLAGVASGDSKIAHEYIIVASRNSAEEIVAEVVVGGDLPPRAPGGVAREPGASSAAIGISTGASTPSQAVQAGGMLSAAMRVSRDQVRAAPQAVHVGLAQPTLPRSSAR